MKRGPISAWTVFGVALLMRFAYIRQLHDSVLWDDLPVDLSYYRDWAIRIAQGEWIGTQVFEQSPLYAYFLAFIFKLFGTGLMVPRLVQAVIGAASCAYIFRIGRHAFGRGAGLAAGLLAAFYGPFLFYDGMIMKESLAVFFMCVFTLHLLESDLRQGGLLWSAGLMLGLGSLVRDNMILVAPAVGIWLLIDPWVRPRDEGPSAARDALGRCAALVFGLAVALAPVAARNYYVAKELVPQTAGGGEVFYIGNNPGADGRYAPPPFVHPESAVEHEDFRQEAARRLHREPGSLTRSESSSYWLQQGLEWIHANPGDWLALEWRKLLLFLNHYELPDNQNYAHHRKLLSILRLPLVAFAWLVPLAAAGGVLTVARWRELIPLYLCGAAYSASVLVFFVFARFRLPVVPVLMVFAGVGLVAAAQEAMARRWRRVVLAGVAMLVGILFVIPDLEDDPLHIGQSHAQLAELLRRSGRIDEAAEESARGLALLEALYERHGTDPGATVALPSILAEALRTQAAILRSGRKVGEAAALERRADGLDPPPARSSREDAAGKIARFLREAEALHKEGRLTEALRKAEAAQKAAVYLPEPERSLSLADAHYGQALIHRDLGEREAMKEHLRDCLRANPEHPRAAWMKEMLAAP